MQIHQWLDNKTVTWSNWRPMEPDCMSPTWSNVCHKQPFTDENCVVIGKMFLFGTADCTTKRVVICQEGKHSVTETLIILFHKHAQRLFVISIILNRSPYR